MKEEKLKIFKTLKASFFIVLCLQIAASFALASWPLNASAANPASLQFEPQIKIPGSSLDADAVNVATYNEETGKMNSDLLAKYIQAFYNYGLAAAGILAAIVLMAGGVLWLTSAGDSARVGQAKELIIGSVVGTAILFSAWIILNTVNPELLKFKSIETMALSTAYLGENCCEIGNQAIMTSSKECTAQNGKYYADNDMSKFIVISGRCEEFKIYCILKVDCDNNIQWCYDSDSSLKPAGRETCGGFLNGQLKDLYELKIGSCTKVAGCNNKLINCRGIANGEKCPKTADGQKFDGYCYDNMCYLGNGGLREPCGKKPEAFCSDTICSQLGPKKYYADTSGGRICAGTVYCCYPE